MRNCPLGPVDIRIIGLFNLAFGHTTKESVVVLLGAQPLMAAAIARSQRQEAAA